MEANESKAQLEVWEWKEKAGAELLKVPKGKRIQYLKEKTSEIIARLNMRKATLKPVAR